MLRDLLIALLATAVLYGGYLWLMSLETAQLVVVLHCLIVGILFGATFSLLRIHRMDSSRSKHERSR